MALPARAVSPRGEAVLPPQLSAPPRRWVPALIVQARVLGLRQERAGLGEMAEGWLHLQMPVLGTARKLTFHVAAPGITRSLA